MAEDTKIVLNYEKRPELWRRRSFRRVCIAIAVVILTGAAMYWRNEITFRVRVAYWQRQCMNHVIPSDKVTLSADPKLIPVLLGDPDYLPMSIAPLNSRIPAAVYRPRCFRELEKLIIPSAPDGAVIFMHRLRSKQGIERLVIVFDPGETYAPAWPQYCAQVAILEPRPLWGRYGTLRDELSFPPSGGSGNYADGPLIRYYPGQIDSTDPSHVTIEWGSYFGGGVLPWRSGFLDVRLSPNGASVERAVRRSITSVIVR